MSESRRRDLLDTSADRLQQQPALGDHERRAVAWDVAGVLQGCGLGDVYRDCGRGIGVCVRAGVGAEGY